MRRGQTECSGASPLRKKPGLHSEVRLLMLLLPLLLCEWR